MARTRERPKSRYDAEHRNEGVSCRSSMWKLWPRAMGVRGWSTGAAGQRIGSATGTGLRFDRLTLVFREVT